MGLGRAQQQVRPRAPAVGSGQGEPKEAPSPSPAPLTPLCLALKRVLIKQHFKDSSAEAPFLISTPC